MVWDVKIGVAGWGVIGFCRVWGRWVGFVGWDWVEQMGEKKMPYHAPCIRVLMTSRGLLQRVEKQPESIPPRKERPGFMLFLPLSVTKALYSLKNMKRSPWLLPCWCVG